MLRVLGEYSVKHDAFLVGATPPCQILTCMGQHGSQAGPLAVTSPTSARKTFSVSSQLFGVMFLTCHLAAGKKSCSYFPMFLRRYRFHPACTVSSHLILVLVANHVGKLIRNVGNIVVWMKGGDSQQQALPMLD